MSVPKRVTATKNLKKIVSAAVGQSHTLLLAQTGEVYAMGDNKNGSLGTPANHTPPAQTC